MFHKPCKAKTSQMHLSITVNSFAFACINRENVPRIFSCKPSKGKTSKMRLNFTAKCFVFGRINCKNAPRILSVNLASG